MIKFLIIMAVFLIVGLIPAFPYLDDTVIFQSELAQGFGRTIVVGALACLGLFYRRNTNLGFGVAALLSTTLIWGGQIYLESKQREAFSQDEPSAPEMSSGTEAETDTGTAASTPVLVGTQKPEPVGSPHVPTLGEFSDKVDIAVTKFAEIYRKSGFAWSQRYSRACEKAALGSSDILETDFCVAFDMSAILFNVALMESTGTPRDKYFDLRATNIDGQYNRFPQAQPNRTGIIWNEVQQRIPAALESVS